MKTWNSPIIWVFLMSLFLSSCIKDTDFTQTEDIEVAPVIELDFLFFDLTSQNFTDLGVANLTVSDTTNFEFLNSDFTSDNLERVEFFFKFSNSIPVDFITEFKFLNQDNVSQYEFSIPVDAGNGTTETITQYIENIDNQGIIDLTNAEKVVITFTASSSLENVAGTLNLQSKTTYYLKIIQ